MKPKQFAIQVLVGEHWVYVSDGPMDNLRVLKLTSLIDAQEALRAWSTEGRIVKIVEFPQ